MNTNNSVQKSLLTLSIFLVVGIGIAHGWSGLTASPNDIITSTKWNEMINKISPISSIGGTSGSVGIGDTSPDHKLDVAGNIGLNGSAFINFGDVDGTSGYGLRDNGGTVQFKHNGGNWTSLAVSSGGDDLGNHTASQNIALDTFWLSGDGEDEGISIDSTGNTNISGSIDVNKDLALRLGADYTTTGTANNVSLGGGTASSVRFNATGNGTITGISGGRNGKVLSIMNVTDSYFLTLVDESTSSTTTNRISTKNGQNLVISPGQTVRLQYDSIATRWRIVDASPIRYIYQTTADQTRNINSYAAIPGLTTGTLPIGSYKFQFIGGFRSSSATSGAGFSLVQNSAVLTRYIAQARIQSTATANYEVSIISTTAPTHFSPNASTTADYYAEVEGIFEVTTAGTVDIRMRPETNGATLTLRSGATLIIQPLN